MYSDKIAYYRKKNLLTQEALAEKLNVSRQTITKWEGGLISPSLEYLIDLSDIFGTTIDSLVKDNDCISDKYEILDTDELSHFIVEAKQNTYANKNNKILPLRSGSHDYLYKNNQYTYCDSFFGSSQFSGQEIVYQSDEVCWSMNYYGKVTDDHFSGDFLKQALSHIHVDQPFRGPELYTKGDYIYICHVTGDLFHFNGEEKIYYQSKPIYECLFHGGIIK